MFIAKFSDGSLFDENMGTWDQCPDNGIVAMELELPLHLQNVFEDGKVEVITPPTVSIAGYEKYYFANINRATLFQGGASGLTVGNLEGNLIAKTIVGIDETNNLSVHIRIETNSNVSVRREKLDEWIKRLGIRTETFKKGII